MLATEPFMLVLRFLHIVAGALWVGSAFLFSGFIGPSAAEVGPSAGPLLGVLVHKRRLPRVIVSLSGVTVLAGWIMWLRNVDRYGGLDEWVGTPFGLGITIGAVFATIAFFVGMLGISKHVVQLVTLGEEIAGAGGPPSPQQAAEMGRLQTTLKTESQIDLLLLLVAVGCMATASYW
jgi:ribose/xylose/arabinose/galactoside ABC-type transport system permease subunit